ncbi:MAG: bifunctional 4-hydroxy-2-oxoglutarate aldolase/2-dehydro-3-deoxy-phosphogluconate aldolase [Gaiella sp.]
MSGADVLTELLARKVVPVVVLEDATRAHALGDALVAGGLPVAEVTFRTPTASLALETLAGRGDLLVGAGTVTSAALVDRAVAAGARFVVSPGLGVDVVERCAELGVPLLPGVATPSEVMHARRHGFELVKLFPAETLGGVAAVRALAAPFPDMRFVPTGGITAANVADYLALSAVAAVGGSWLVAAELVARGDFAEVEHRTAEAVRLAGGAA